MIFKDLSKLLKDKNLSTILTFKDPRGDLFLLRGEGGNFKDL